MEFRLKFQFILFSLSCLYKLSQFQKSPYEKGESPYPFLVNLWIPKNEEIGQRTSRFCDAVQLTAFTDYFFTTAKCFDNLQHDMWIQDVGVSFDEYIVMYSRHMSFLTRYKEDGGHFVILERYEINRSVDNEETTEFFYEKEGVDDTEENTETDDMNKFSPISEKRKYIESISERTTRKSTIGKYNKRTTNTKYVEIFGDKLNYSQIHAVENIEDNYEVSYQVHDDVNKKSPKQIWKNKVSLSTSEILDTTECYVLGWGTCMKPYKNIRDLTGTQLKKELVTKLPSRDCKSPDPAHLCISKTNEARFSVEDFGSPLICEEKYDGSNTPTMTMIGIYTGFRNCLTTETNSIIYRSLDSELPWIARWAKGTSIKTIRLSYPNSRKNLETSRWSSARMQPRMPSIRPSKNKKKKRKKKKRGYASRHRMNIYLSIFMLIFTMLYGK